MNTSNEQNPTLSSSLVVEQADSGAYEVRRRDAAGLEDLHVAIHTFDNLTSNNPTTFIRTSSVQQYDDLPVNARTEDGCCRAASTNYI